VSRDQLLGAIYGHLVGDAFGVPYEFTSPNRLPADLEWRGHGTHNQPAGTWSDDGALMLCLLASLLEKRAFDPEDAGRRFVAWYDEGYMAAGGVVFDIGGTTRSAISRLRKGVPALEAGSRSEQSNGNGSLMRILPLALWAARDPTENLIALCHDGSKLTHGHFCSQVSCAVYGLLVRLLLARAPRSDAWQLALDAMEQAYLADSRGNTPYLNEVAHIRGFTECTGSGHVVDCLCSGWQAVLAAEDYADAIRGAVRFGNDTDTTAAVAGSLAGIFFGHSAIPAEWLEGLRLADEHRQMISDFVAACPAGGRASNAGALGETSWRRDERS
jgi:ADP-ribosyl-[dinitrogen reductase] hydrolase